MDSGVQQRDASLLNPAGRYYSGPALSDGRGWISELRPEKYSLHLWSDSLTDWTQSKVCFSLKQKLLNHCGQTSDICEITKISLNLFWLFSCYMFHLLHQIVSNCVSLLFAAGQVVYSGFIRACLMKTAACCCWKRHRWSIELESIPADTGQEGRYILDQSSVHHRTDTQRQSPTNLS